MKHVLTLMACLWAGILSAGVINYQADDATIFPNPERGFTDQLGGEVALTDSKPNVVKREEDWYWDIEDENYDERKNQSIVMLMYYLKNYRTKDLSDKLLHGFNDEDMQILRNHGFKCVLRFAYDWSSGNDATLQWVQRHAAQLKPYLAANADVIYVMEAGFVGQWGEWYYSSNFVNETQKMNNNRKAVLTAVLDACPADRFVGSTRARIGHHNDAFLNAWGNDGTYGRDGDGPDNDPVLRRYVSTETLYVPNGGETNVESNSLANVVAQHDTTIAELSRFHWSFCGSEYAQAVTNKWRNNGTFAEMEKRLGYRFQLKQGTYPTQAAKGGTMPIQITLVNKGFAPMYNYRPVYLVLKNAQHTYSVQLQADPRKWTAEAGTITINEAPVLPATIAEGTYQMYLHLPDAYESLASDPRYAVRFANQNVWDQNTGMNDLGVSVEVVAGGQQAITNQQAEIKPQKQFRDGRVMIVRGDKTYSVLGVEE